MRRSPNWSLRQLLKKKHFIHLLHVCAWAKSRRRARVPSPSASAAFAASISPSSIVVSLIYYWLILWNASTRSISCYIPLLGMSETKPSCIEVKNLRRNSRIVHKLRFLILCRGRLGWNPLWADIGTDKFVRQRGNPGSRESRKKFTSGASTRQTFTIKLGRRSL